MRRKRLDKHLGLVDDEKIFIMVWAAVAAQSSREDLARQIMHVPRDWVTEEILHKRYLHRWLLETLMNELLATPKTPRDRGFRHADYGRIEGLALLFNLVYDLERADDAVDLKHQSVMLLMHRLQHRQFEWQHGFGSTSAMYRAAHIFGGELTKAYFAETHGCDMSDFMLACFALSGLWGQAPVCTRDINLSEIGLGPDVVRATWDLVSVPHEEARQQAARLRSRVSHTGYQPSLFRLTPCVSFGTNNERLHCPLTELLALRSSTGLFYDVAGGGGKVRNEISGRFESYCVELLGAMLPSYLCAGEWRYASGSNPKDTPDVLISKNDQTTLVVECKARRMSFGARFAGDPIHETREAFAEIAHGIFQLWRFASHCRRGIVPNARLASAPLGLVLTLDPWASISIPLQTELFDMALAEADGDPGILIVDRIPVAICAIDDLERTLRNATEQSLFAALRAFTIPEYRGWSLFGVHREVAPDVSEGREYPFEGRLETVHPWLKRYDQMPSVSGIL